MDRDTDKGKDGGASCAWCAASRYLGDDTDTRILKTIGRRFGADAEQAAHDAIHGAMPLSLRDDHVRPFPPEWWDGPDGDACAPPVGGDVLLSLTRLCAAMTAIGTPGGGPGSRGGRKSETEWARWRRCAALIRAAGRTAPTADARTRTGTAPYPDTDTDADAGRYAAAAVIDPDPPARPDGRTSPPLTLDDISTLLEDVAGIGRGWPQTHETVIHRHLPALARMRRDGARIGEIRETITILGSKENQLMRLATDTGADTDLDAVRAVLSLHRLTRHPGRATGWRGDGDTEGRWEHWRAPVAKAIALAGIRHMEGTAADPATEDGRTAMGRAAATLTRSHARLRKDTDGAAPDDGLPTLMSHAARAAAADPDAMDMICLTARTADAIRTTTGADPMGPVLEAGGKGIHALTEAALMAADGLPTPFIAETLYASIGAPMPAPADPTH